MCALQQSITHRNIVPPQNMARLCTHRVDLIDHFGGAHQQGGAGVGNGLHRTMLAEQGFGVKAVSRRKEHDTGEQHPAARLGSAKQPTWRPPEQKMCLSFATTAHSTDHSMHTWQPPEQKVPLPWISMLSNLNCQKPRRLTDTLRAANKPGPEGT